jgi:hypothetical protein
MEDYNLYDELHSMYTSDHFESEATNPDHVSDDYMFWEYIFGHEDF